MLESLTKTERETVRQTVRDRLTETHRNRPQESGRQERHTDKTENERDETHRGSQNAQTLTSSSSSSSSPSSSSRGAGAWGATTVTHSSGNVKVSVRGRVHSWIPSMQPRRASSICRTEDETLLPGAWTEQASSNRDLERLEPTTCASGSRNTCGK